jgi:heme exporter protein D
LGAAFTAGAGAALPWAALGAAFLAMVVGMLQHGVEGLDRVLRARPRQARDKARTRTDQGMT